MFKGLLHRILILVLVTMVALASAKAQSPYVILPGSTHKLTITDHVGNTYEWKVYKVNNWADQKDALLADNDGLGGDDDFLFIGGEFEKAEVDITFFNEGKYYAIVEEFSAGTNFCSSRRAIPVEVFGPEATIAFKDLTSEDCADLDPQFAAEMVAMFDSGTQLPESQYPITVNYRLDGDSADRTAIVNFADKMLHVAGVIEDENIDTINTITIKSATNKYGGTLNVVTEKEIHTRTINKKPKISIINLN
ncbi:hypothetical protein [Labilibaculum euxinus]|uniref:Uncharacterized protein n=1 Tax=Labilibaculum euxinus TaxID=2686357 RepID=A0A7M4DAH4_9BACT|nr:hypothetical protein [Labilibaculum euxinus]MUP39653.1 hypothetical protein [Labilibaculum euxinus]MVB08858.1 hypothetical protein [Labilibaculum euxinus]